MANGMLGLVFENGGYLRAGGYGAKQCMDSVQPYILTRERTSRAHHNPLRIRLCSPRASSAKSVHVAGRMMASSVEC